MITSLIPILGKKNQIFFKHSSFKNIAPLAVMISTEKYLYSRKGKRNLCSVHPMEK